MSMLLQTTVRGTIQKFFTGWGETEEVVGKWWLAPTFSMTMHLHIPGTGFLSETFHHSGCLASYSPILAPSNFWLFPKLQTPLKGKRFWTRFSRMWKGDWKRTINILRYGRASEISVWSPLKLTKAPLCYDSNFSQNITWLITFWTPLVKYFYYVYS